MPTNEGEVYKYVSEGAIKRAIENGQFDIYYQPKVDNNGDPVIYEALCRWINSCPEDKIDGRCPYPDEFFHTAKIEGTILTLSKYIVKHIVKDLDKYEQLQKVSINISSREIQNDDHLLTILEMIGDKVKRVKFESTEDASYSEAAISNIGWLKKRGFQFGLDDFGKAYNANLALLLVLNPDFVKFDRSLVSRCDQFLYNKFCQKLVSFFREDMNVFTTAEGVETKEQLEILEKIGFDFFQGYLISHPLPPEKLFQILSQPVIPEDMT